jgi:hypothetical protein
MSYREENGQVVLTDWMVEPMAEVLLYRMTLLPLALTGRQKALGQALFRFMASRNDVWQLPAKHVIDYSGIAHSPDCPGCKFVDDYKAFIFRLLDQLEEIERGGEMH